MPSCAHGTYGGPCGKCMYCERTRIERDYTIALGKWINEGNYGLPDELGRRLLAAIRDTAGGSTGGDDAA